MGLGFVLLAHLILLFIASLIIAVVAAIITFIASRKKRKTLLAFCLPFVFLFSLYFSGLIGSIIVSETKNVDIGIGDAWYAPICDSCNVMMIDVTHIGYINCCNGIDIDEITELQQYFDTVIAGKTADKFFVLNLNNKEVKYYYSEQELIENAGTDGHDFLKIYDFYAKKYRQAVGILMIIVGIISLIISILVSFLFSKIFLFIINKFVSLLQKNRK